MPVQVTHNNNGQFYRIAIDIAKEGAQLFDLSPYFKGRVGDNNFGLQIVWYYQGQLLNVVGMKPYVEGQAGQYSFEKDDNGKDQLVMSNKASTVSFEGDPNDCQEGGRVTYYFPEQMFPQDGCFKGSIGLVDDSGKTAHYTSVDVWFKILPGGYGYMGKACAFYINKLDIALKKAEDMLKDKQASMQEVVDKFTTKMNDLSTQLTTQANNNQTLLADVQTNLAALQAKIKEDGLFTQAEAEAFEQSILNELNKRGNRSYDTVADMKADKTLIAGITVQTMGYYKINDGGAASYKIVEDAPNTHFEKIDNGLYGQLVLGSQIDVATYGGVGSDNDSASLIAAWQDLIKLNGELGFCASKRLNLTTPVDLDGAGKHLDVKLRYLSNLVGTGVTIHNLRGSKIEVHVDGGGQGTQTTNQGITYYSDIALEIYGNYDCQVNVYGSNYKGLLLRVDGKNSDFTRNIGMNLIVKNHLCYQTVFHGDFEETTSGFGSYTDIFEEVYDLSDKALASIFLNVFDVSFAHYETFFDSEISDNNVYMSNCGSNYAGYLALGGKSKKSLLSLDHTELYVDKLYICGKSDSETANGAISMANSSTLTNNILSLYRIGKMPIDIKTSCSLNVKKIDFFNDSPSSSRLAYFEDFSKIATAPSSSNLDTAKLYSVLCSGDNVQIGYADSFYGKSPIYSKGIKTTFSASGELHFDFGIRSYVNAINIALKLYFESIAVDTILTINYCEYDSNSKLIQERQLMQGSTDVERNAWGISNDNSLNFELPKATKGAAYGRIQIVASGAVITNLSQLELREII